MLAVLSHVNPPSPREPSPGRAPHGVYSSKLQLTGVPNLFCASRRKGSGFNLRVVDLDSANTVTFDNSLCAAFDGLSRSEIAFASDG
jgi:hypothetical protein